MSTLKIRELPPTEELDRSTQAELRGGTTVLPGGCMSPIPTMPSFPSMPPLPYWPFAPHPQEPIPCDTPPYTDERVTTPLPGDDRAHIM